MPNRVGLGTFPFANVFNKASDKQIQAVIDNFLTSGGYYIDTAPLYGFGVVETKLGKMLKKYPRDSYFLASKCGYVNVDGKDFNSVQKGATYQDVIRECHNSLRRLETDYLDLYMVHSPDRLTSYEETLTALQTLKNQGKIKQIGVSNVNLEELKRYNQSGDVRYVQNRFNLITRSINTDFADYLSANNISLIPYHVLEIGLLTDSALNDVERLDESDLRTTLPYWKPDQLSMVVKWVRYQLAPIAKQRGCTISQLAIAWTLHQKSVSFAIVGTTKNRYVSTNLKADGISLDINILKEIENTYHRLEKEVKNRYHTSLRQFRGLNDKYY